MDAANARARFWKAHRCATPEPDAGSGWPDAANGAMMHRYAPTVCRVASRPWPARRIPPSIADSRGSSLVEYLLIVGCVALLGLAGFRLFGAEVQSKAQK